MDEDSVREALSAFGLDGVRVLGSHSSTNTSYFVDDSIGGRFVLHDRRYVTEPAYIDFMYSTTEHLRKHEIPVPQAFQTKEGYFWCRTSDSGLFTLEQRLDTLGWRFSIQELRNAAIVLANIHNINKNFQPEGQENPEGLGDINYLQWVTELGFIQRYRDIIFRKRDRTWQDEKILKGLGLIERIAPLIQEKTASLYPYLERTIIHGDAHPYNMLFDRDSGIVLGVLDFENAKKRTRLRDAANSALHFSTVSSYELDLERYRTFVATYNSVNPLTREELDVLPEVMQASTFEGIFFFLQLAYDPQKLPPHMQDVLVKMLGSIWDIEKRKEEIRRSITPRHFIKYRDNDYGHLEDDFTRQTGQQLVRSLDDAISEYTSREKTPFYRDGVSVVIPTYNGMNRLALEATLTSLNHQTFLQNPANRMEVIVVDDGSTDGTEKMIEKIIVNYKLKYVKQQNAGPSYARNTGAALAENEIILFLDNDVVAFPHTVEEHARVHNVLDNILLCGSRDYVEPSDPIIQVDAINTNPYGLLHAQLTSNPKDPLSQHTRREWRHEWWRQTDGLKNLRAPIPKHLIPYFNGEERFDTKHVPKNCVSANISLQRENLMRIGGFVDFPGWAGEDTFLGAESFSAGLYLVPSQSANVLHVEHEVGKKDGQYTGNPNRDLHINTERYEVYLDEPIEPRSCTTPIRFRKVREAGRKSFYLVEHILELQHQHPFDREIAPFRERAKRDPNARYMLGKELTYNGRPIEGMYTLYDTLQGNPSHIGAMVHLGNNFILRGDLQGAKYWFKKVLFIDNSNTYARDQLSRLSK